VEVPASLGNLEKLTRLGLEDNQLQVLHPKIQNLAHLKILNLNGNQLAQLPKSMGALHQLEWLGLANNQFTEFPSVVFDLPNLKTLDLRGNKIKHIPTEALMIQHLIID